MNIFVISRNRQRTTLRTCGCCKKDFTFQKMEDRTMKKRMAVLFIGVMVGMILGMMQPAVIFAGQTIQGNPWDDLVNQSPYTGTKLSGPLSIYYQFTGISGCYNMYHTVRLTKGFQPYLFQGSAQICFGDQDNVPEKSWNDVIKPFLESVVSEIFPSGYKGWVLKAIDNGMYHDESVPPFSRAFVADITIAVKQ
jgi:hypothetical protein